MRAITPMKDDLARKIRATAASVDKTHPETVAAQHLRNAATLVQHGQGDGAKRHLDAAMELMTPRNLIRHGITDDEGHATAKAAMHKMNVHRLGVMDIQDAQARNNKEADAKKQASDQQDQAKQAAAAAKQQATPPPPASGQQNGGGQQNQPPASPPGKQPAGGKQPPGQQASDGGNAWPTPILAQSFSNVDLSAKTAMLEATPAPYGKPGGPGLYGKAGNKHSDYFEQIVTALMSKRGMDKATASKIAWGALRKWSAGGGGVHPEVRAAAAGALVKEAAAGARAALANSTDAIELGWRDAYKTEDRGKGGQWVGELSGAVRDLAGKTGNSEADDHLRKAADAIGAQDKATAQQHLRAADDLISASMRGHGMATDAEHRQGNAALMRIRQHMRGTGDLPDTKPAQLSGGWDTIDRLIELSVRLSIADETRNTSGEWAAMSSADKAKALTPAEKKQYIKTGALPDRYKSVKAHDTASATASRDAKAKIVADRAERAARTDVEPAQASPPEDEDAKYARQEKAEQAYFAKLADAGMDPNKAYWSRSPKENVALMDYVSPLGCDVINGALRAGKMPDGKSGQGMDRGEVVKNLDEVIAANHTAKPMTVYRGMSVPPGMDLKPGSTFSDKAYVSVSTDKKIADDFASARSTGKTPDGQVVEGVKRGGRAVTMIISMPSGQQAYMGMPHLGELVLPRGSQFHVDSASGDGSVLHVSVVPGGARSVSLVAASGSDLPWAAKGYKPAAPAEVRRLTWEPGDITVTSGGSEHTGVNGRAIELVGPKGYIHGWIKVGPAGAANDYKTVDKMTKAELKQHLGSQHSGAPAGGRHLGPRNPSVAYLRAQHEMMHRVMEQGGAGVSSGIAHTHGMGNVPKPGYSFVSGWDTIDRLIDLAAAQQGGSNARSQNAQNQARVPKGQPGGGQFGTGGKGKAGKAGKGSGSHAAQKHALLAKAATIRGQIKALAAQIKSANSTAAKSPAAAASSAKKAASTKAAPAASTAAKAAKSTTTASKTPTVAQMTTQMTALRGQLAKVMAQIHQLG